MTKDWEDVKNDIHLQYVTHGQKLEDVREWMRMHNQFDAS